MDLDGNHQSLCGFDTAVASRRSRSVRPDLHDLELEYSFWTENSFQFPDLGSSNLVNDCVSRN